MSLYLTTVLQDNPALYWRLGEPSGTNANDETANNRDGTYTGGYTLAQTGALTGDADAAVSLNGSSGYVTSSYNPFTNGTVRSFEGWAYRINLNHGSGYNDAPFGGNDTATNNAPALYLLVDTLHVTFQAQNSGTVINWPNAWPGVGQWVHWVLVFDEAGNTVELFINGASKGSQALVQGYIASPGNIRVGGMAYSGGPYHFFYGVVDEFAVYEYGLSAARIRHHHLVGSGKLFGDEKVLSPQPGPALYA